MLIVRALVWAAATLALAGCAWLRTPQSDALTEFRPTGLSPRAELASVPFIPQTPLHCGPASLATVLRHAGIGAGADELSDAVFLPARGGSLQAEMLAAARRKGAVATRLPPRIEALLLEVATGTPVVVLQNLGLALAPVWHYAVLVGYDLDRRELVLRSGTTERELMPFSTFEHTWARGGYWAFVVQQPGRLPLTAELSAATDAALGFERAASPQMAALQYQALLSRWPDSLIAMMGLGNAQLAAGATGAAAQAFEAAAKRHDSAAAWNNLALLRWQLGDAPGARAALAQAQRRVQQDEPRWTQAVQATQATIEGR